MSCPSTAIVYGATEDVLLGDALAELVPGAAHITDSHSGHNIMIGNAPVVIQAIRIGGRRGESWADLAQGWRINGHPGGLNGCPLLGKQRKSFARIELFRV